VKIAPARPADVILDNGQLGTSPTGAWYISGGGNPYGSSSLYSRGTGASYRFAPALPCPGTYRVSLWWTTYPSRLEKVPVDIAHASGTTTVFVNQKLNGGRWNDVGTFSFVSGATITIRSLGVGTTCADAVKLSPASAPPASSLDAVLDNGAQGTSAKGGWYVSGGANPYGKDSLYSKQAGATYSYAIGLPSTGRYEVFLWWTEWPSRLSSIPVDIASGSGGVSTRTIDQTKNGGRWNSLGLLEASGTLTVTIRSPGVGTTCTDAVRVVQAP